MGNIVVLHKTPLKTWLMHRKCFVPFSQTSSPRLQAGLNKND